MLQAARNLRVEREKEHTLGQQKLEQKNQVINTWVINYYLVYHRHAMVEVCWLHHSCPGVKMGTGKFNAGGSPAMD